MAAALALTACDDSSRPEALSSGDLTTYVGTQGDGSGDAEIGNLLVQTDSGCLAAEIDGMRFVLVWPQGTELLADGVNVPGAGEITLGDSFSAGGSYLERLDDERLPEIDPKCFDGAEHEVAFIEDSSSVEV